MLLQIESEFLMALKPQHGTPASQACRFLSVLTLLLKFLSEKSILSSLVTEGLKQSPMNRLKYPFSVTFSRQN